MAAGHVALLLLAVCSPVCWAQLQWTGLFSTMGWSLPPPSGAPWNPSGIYWSQPPGMSWPTPPPGGFSWGPGGFSWSPGGFSWGPGGFSGGPYPGPGRVPHPCEQPVEDALDQDLKPRLETVLCASRRVSELGAWFQYIRVPDLRYPDLSFLGGGSTPNPGGYSPPPGGWTPAYGGYSGAYGPYPTPTAGPGIYSHYGHQYNCSRFSQMWATLSDNDVLLEAQTAVQDGLNFINTQFGSRVSSVAQCVSTSLPAGTTTQTFSFELQEMQRVYDNMTSVLRNFTLRMEDAVNNALAGVSPPPGMTLPPGMHWSPPPGMNWPTPPPGGFSWGPGGFSWGPGGFSGGPYPGPGGPGRGPHPCEQPVEDALDQDLKPRLETVLCASRRVSELGAWFQYIRVPDLRYPDLSFLGGGSTPNPGSYSPPPGGWTPAYGGYSGAYGPYPTPTAGPGIYSHYGHQYNCSRFSQVWATLSGNDVLLEAQTAVQDGLNFINTQFGSRVSSVAQCVSTSLPAGTTTQTFSFELQEMQRVYDNMTSVLRNFTFRMEDAVNNALAGVSPPPGMSLPTPPLATGMGWSLPPGFSGPTPPPGIGWSLPPGGFSWGPGGFSGGPHLGPGGPGRVPHPCEQPVEDALDQDLKPQLETVLCASRRVNELGAWFQYIRVPDLRYPDLSFLGGGSTPNPGSYSPPPGGWTPAYGGYSGAYGPYPTPTAGPGIHSHYGHQYNCSRFSQAWASLSDNDVLLSAQTAVQDGLNFINMHFGSRVSSVAQCVSTSLPAGTTTQTFSFELQEMQRVYDNMTSVLRNFTLRMEDAVNNALAGVSPPPGMSLPTPPPGMGWSLPPGFSGPPPTPGMGWSLPPGFSGPTPPPGMGWSLPPGFSGPTPPPGMGWSLPPSGFSWGPGGFSGGPHSGPGGPVRVPHPCEQPVEDALDQDLKPQLETVLCASRRVNELGAWFQYIRVPDLRYPDLSFLGGGSTPNPGGYSPPPGGWTPAYGGYSGAYGPYPTPTAGPGIHSHYGHQYNCSRFSQAWVSLSDNDVLLSAQTAVQDGLNFINMHFGSRVSSVAQCVSTSLPAGTTTQTFSFELQEMQRVYDNMTSVLRNFTLRMEDAVNNALAGVSPPPGMSLPTPPPGMGWSLPPGFSGPPPTPGMGWSLPPGFSGPTPPPGMGWSLPPGFSGPTPPPGMGWSLPPGFSGPTPPPGMGWSLPPGGFSWGPGGFSGGPHPGPGGPGRVPHPCEQPVEDALDQDLKPQLETVLCASRRVNELGAWFQYIRVPDLRYPDLSFLGGGSTPNPGGYSPPPGGWTPAYGGYSGAYGPYPTPTAGPGIHSHYGHQYNCSRFSQAWVSLSDNDVLLSAQTAVQDGLNFINMHFGSRVSSVAQCVSTSLPAGTTTQTFSFELQEMERVYDNMTSVLRNFTLRMEDAVNNALAGVSPPPGMSLPTPPPGMGWSLPPGFSGPPPAPGMGWSLPPGFSGPTPPPGMGWSLPPGFSGPTPPPGMGWSLPPGFSGPTPPPGMGWSLPPGGFSWGPGGFSGGPHLGPGGPGRVPHPCEQPVEDALDQDLKPQLETVLCASRRVNELGAWFQYIRVPDLRYPDLSFLGGGSTPNPGSYSPPPGGWTPAYGGYSGAYGPYPTPTAGPGIHSHYGHQYNCSRFSQAWVSLSDNDVLLSAQTAVQDGLNFINMHFGSRVSSVAQCVSTSLPAGTTTQTFSFELQEMQRVYDNMTSVLRNFTLRMEDAVNNALAGVSPPPGMSLPTPSPGMGWSLPPGFSGPPPTPGMGWSLPPGFSGPTPPPGMGWSLPPGFSGPTPPPGMGWSLPPGFSGPTPPPGMGWSLPPGGFSWGPGGFSGGPHPGPGGPGRVPHPCEQPVEDALDQDLKSQLETVLCASRRVNELGAWFQYIRVPDLRYPDLSFLGGGSTPNPGSYSPPPGGWTPAYGGYSGAYGPYPTPTAGPGIHSHYGHQYNCSRFSQAWVTLSDNDVLLEAQTAVQDGLNFINTQFGSRVSSVAQCVSTSLPAGTTTQTFSFELQEMQRVYDNMTSVLRNFTLRMEDAVNNVLAGVSPPPGSSLPTPPPGMGWSPPPGFSGPPPPPGIGWSLPPGISGPTPPPGMGWSLPPGFSGPTPPPGMSMSTPPPGMGWSRPPGFSGPTPPPGFSGPTPPPGMGWSPPPGFSGPTPLPGMGWSLPPGFSGPTPPPGMGWSLPPGISGPTPPPGMGWSLPPGFSGPTPPPGMSMPTPPPSMGWSRLPGFSGPTPPSGFSGPTPPPGMGWSLPTGFSGPTPLPGMGWSLPPGFSGPIPPPGMGWSLPPGFSGPTLPPGMGWSLPPGFSGPTPPPGFSGPPPPSSMSGPTPPPGPGGPTPLPPGQGPTTSTPQPRPLVNVSLVESCFVLFPHLIDMPAFLEESVSCAGKAAPNLDANLQTVQEPQMFLPDASLVFQGAASGASWSAVPVTMGLVNYTCSHAPFANMPEIAILANVSQQMEVGLREFRRNVTRFLMASSTCMANQLGPNLAMLYSREMATLSGMYRQVADAFVTYGDQAMNAITRLTGCRGASDCNGDCGGTARFDPNCRTCYGGRTRYRVQDPRDLIDCNGDCLGTAVVEACRQTCVGGNTGLLASAFLDCAGVCNGTNVRDTCGRCVSPASAAQFPRGSKYMDCTNKCFVRANMSRMAVENRCGHCVLGDTGRSLDFGMDACGVCGGNGASCLDCAGVPNGGKVVDACGVCDGDGTSCIAVVTATPKLLPSAVRKIISVSGAGLRSAQCVAESNANSAQTSLTMSRAQNTMIAVVVPDILATGDYTVKCKQPGGSFAASTATFTVYDSSAVTVTAASTSSFTLTSGNTETVTFTGAGFVNNSTYCKLTDTAGNVNLTAATVLGPTGATCDINHPSRSNRYTVELSLNGEDTVGSSFTVTAYATAPSVTAQFSDDGGKLFVRFNPPAAITRGQVCDDIFDNGASTFGTDAFCKVVSPRLVVVKKAKQATPGSTITLKANAVKARGESFSHVASGSVTVSAPTNPITPTIELKGPARVSACKSRFKVNARKSKGLGGRPGTYTWTVSPSASVTLSGASTKVLTVRNPSPGTTYTVTLQLCNFMGQCDTKSHSVTQSANTAPDVAIETLVDVDQIKPSDRFDLIAKATLYKGCADDDIVFSWSFDKTFTINTDYQTRATYTIEPYVLPAPDTIVATVRAALASNTSTYNEESVTITTQLSELEALIDGAEVQTVGIGSEDLELDATVSVDPDSLTGDTTYEWTCEVVTDLGTETCLDQAGEVMPNATTKAQGLITVSSSDLEADTNYVFKAVVSKKSYGITRFSTASVTVEATTGDPPRIKLDLVNDERGKYSVDDIVTIAAKVKSSTTPTLTWEALSLDGYGYVDVSDSSNIEQQESPRLVDANTNTYISFLSIKSDVLERGTWYFMQCTVTDSQGQSAVAKVPFFIYNGVTACQVSVDGGTYTELDSVTGGTDECYTDTDGYPLTYSFYVAKDANATNLERLTKPSPDSSLSLTYGPRAYFTSGNIFAVKVCARKGGCSSFVSAAVTVSTVTSSAVSGKKTQILDAANDLKKSGDPVAGMLFLKTFLQISLGKARRKRSTNPVTPDVHGLVIDYVNDTLSTTYASQEVLDTVMDVLGSLPLDSISNEDLARIAELYQTIVTGYTGTGAPTMKSDFLAQIKQFVEYVTKTRSLSDSLTSSLDTAVGPAFKKNQAFGSKSEVSSGSGTISYTVAQLSSSQQSKSTGNPIGVTFGSSLSSTYSTWTCDSSTCFGIGIEMNHYDTDQDVYTSSSVSGSRASDVFDLKLYNPNSGYDVNVTGLSDPVTISFPITQSSSGTLQCKYWKEDTQEWSSDGVTTGVQTGSSVECQSTHLTSFAVFSEDSDDSDNTALIGGVVGGVIAAVFVIALVVILAMYINKKQKSADGEPAHGSRLTGTRQRVGSADAVSRPSRQTTARPASRQDTSITLQEMDGDFNVRPTTVRQISVGARLGSAFSTTRAVSPLGVGPSDLDMTPGPATTRQINVSPLGMSSDYEINVGDPAHALDDDVPPPALYRFKTDFEA